METRYRWSATDIESLRTATQSAQDALATALTLTTDLITAMEADAAWSGEHTVALLAWLDLVKQYHTRLAGPEIGPAAVQALDGFLTSLAGYYQASGLYTSLAGVG